MNITPLLVLVSKSLSSDIFNSEKAGLLSNTMRVPHPVTSTFLHSPSDTFYSNYSLYITPYPYSIYKYRCFLYIRACRLSNMGCGRSKLSTSPEIDLSLELTYVARYDEVVSILQSPFDVLIAGLKVLRNDLRLLLRTFSLWEVVSNPSIRDVLLALSLLIASEFKGDLSPSGFQITSKSPYISLERVTLSGESMRKFELVRGFIQRIEAIPSEIRAIQPVLGNALTRANAITAAHRTELNNSNLGALEANRTLEKIKRNNEKIKVAITLAGETVDTATSTLKLLKSSTNLLHQYSHLWSQVDSNDLESNIRRLWPQPNRLL